MLASLSFQIPCPYMFVFSYVSVVSLVSDSVCFMFRFWFKFVLYLGLRLPGLG